MSALSDLLYAINRVQTITREGYGEAAKARDIPGNAEGEFAYLKIIPAYRDGFSPGVEALVDALKKQMAGEARERGEERRDAELRKLAAKLESLRDTLPGLAARATIEIGITARALADEAKGRL